MEAVRILKAIGVQPERTIRIALWSGEEQGLDCGEASAFALIFPATSCNFLTE
jgi:Zn-dependent M28 family amino/carboxypeptidase